MRHSTQFSGRGIDRVLSKCHAEYWQNFKSSLIFIIHYGLVKLFKVKHYCLLKGAS